MKVRCLAVLILCVAVLMGTVACSDGGAASNGMTGAEIMAMSETATVNSLQFSATVETGMMGETYGMYMAGAIDEADREMYMTMTSPDIVDYTMQIYIADDWLYMIDPEYGTSWIKTQLTEDMWEEQNLTAQNMELLDNFIKAEYIGMENIGGLNCYKIEVDPSWDAIFSATDMEETEGVSTEEIIDMIKDTSCIAWIAEGTYYPMQIFFSMTMEMDILGQVYSMTMDMTMTCSDINQPVNITLPVAAQNAEEVSYEDFMSGNY